jgi:hypothetical protein
LPSTYKLADVILLVGVYARLMILEVTPLPERLATVGKGTRIRSIISVQSLMNFEGSICQELLTTLKFIKTNKFVSTKNCFNSYLITDIAPLTRVSFEMIAQSSSRVKRLVTRSTLKVVDFFQAFRKLQVFLIILDVTSF